MLRVDFSTFRYEVLPVRVTVTGLSAWVSTVTESAVADAIVPRTRSGIPVAANAADEARAEAAIARPRIRFGLMFSPSEIVAHRVDAPPRRFIPIDEKPLKAPAIDMRRRRRTAGAI